MIRTAVSALALAAALAVGVAVAMPARAAEPVAISTTPAAGAFPLIADGRSARIETDVTDWPGVIRAVNDVRSDLSRLSADAEAAKDAPVVIIGTIGRSAAIDAMVASGKLDVTGVKGQWEAFVQQVVENPRPGVARALVVAGADKRGTIFGAYDLIERAGVSPWTWWADAPIPVKDQVYVAAGRRVQKPAVKYRGIFLNDEGPALSGWARQRFGGVNHEFYAKVFELTLRLKGNFLWPAMWGKSIYDDDPLKRAAGRRIRRGAGHLAPRTAGASPRRLGALRPGAVGLHQEPREATRLLARGRQAHGVERERADGGHARRRRRTDDAGHGHPTA